MARKKQSQIEVKSFNDIRDVLVNTLNRMNNKEITSAEGKTITYIMQTLLSVQKNIMEAEDSGQDSIKELVMLIHEARGNKSGFPWP